MFVLYDGGYATRNSAIYRVDSFSLGRIWSALAVLFYTTASMITMVMSPGTTSYRLWLTRDTVISSWLNGEQHPRTVTR